MLRGICKSSNNKLTQNTHETATQNTTMTEAFQPKYSYSDLAFIEQEHKPDLISQLHTLLQI